MAVAGSEVIFLADRLTGRDEIHALRGLADRLERLGHAPRILCLSAAADHGIDELAECPGLGRRWLRPWAVRGLDLGEPTGRPRLMHVLTGRMAEAGLEIADRYGIPYLQAVEDFPRPNWRFRLGRAWCRGLVVPGRELADALMRDFRVPDRAIHRIPPGIEAPGGPARPAGPGRVPVVGAAGPLVASSGFSTFLNAARKVVDAGLDAEFLIAGQGEDEGNLRRRAERLRIAERLTFADDLPDGLRFWQVLDVYCQTSVAPTVGRPLMMAMASGVPSIASDVEGLRDLVRGGESALNVAPGDSAALARSILGLLQDRGRARSLGDSGKAAVRVEHDPGREAGRLDALYRGIVEAGLGPQDSGLVSRSGEAEGVLPLRVEADPGPGSDRLRS